MSPTKGRAVTEGDEAMENGEPHNPKLLVDEKGFARSDLEKYDDDGHVARTGNVFCDLLHSADEPQLTPRPLPDHRRINCIRISIFVSTTVQRPSVPRCLMTRKCRSKMVRSGGGLVTQVAGSRPTPTLCALSLAAASCPSPGESPGLVRFCAAAL